MKLVVDKNYKNSRGKKLKDDKSVKTFPEVKLNDTPVPGKNVDDLDPTLPIKFGTPWITYYDIYRPLNPEEREIYEWFCCGYLFRQDQLFSGPGIMNHGIHFVWESAHKVSIYIYPSSTGSGAAIDPQPPPAPPPPPQFL